MARAVDYVGRMLRPSRRAWPMDENVVQKKMAIVLYSNERRNHEIKWRAEFRVPRMQCRARPRLPDWNNITASHQRAGSSATSLATPQATSEAPDRLGRQQRISDGSELNRAPNSRKQKDHPGATVVSRRRVAWHSLSASPFSPAQCRTPSPKTFDSYSACIRQFLSWFAVLYFYFGLLPPSQTA